VKILTAVVICITVLYGMDAYFFNGQYFEAAHRILNELLHY